MLLVAPCILWNSELENMKTAVCVVPRCSLDFRFFLQSRTAISYSLGRLHMHSQGRRMQWMYRCRLALV